MQIYLILKKLDFFIRNQVFNYTIYFLRLNLLANIHAILITTIDDNTKAISRVDILLLELRLFLSILPIAGFVLSFGTGICC